MERRPPVYSEDGETGCMRRKAPLIDDEPWDEKATDENLLYALFFVLANIWFYPYVDCFY